MNGTIAGTLVLVAAVILMAVAAMGDDRWLATAALAAFPAGRNR